MKYYFIYYKCKQFSWKPDGTCQEPHEMECQAIEKKHPLQFEIDCNNEFSKIHESDGGYRKREEYKVISWQVLSKAEYNKYKGWIG